MKTNTTINPKTLIKSEPGGFSCPTCTDENPAAHGNITVRETDPATGFWRSVNINGHHREEGPWRQTVDNTREISALTRRLDRLAAEISADLRRGAKDGLTGEVSAARCRDLALRGPMIATGWQKFNYLAETAEKIEEHARIKTELETLKKAEGSRPVAAKIRD
jgi:hypothetical protein